ncbi:MAG: hypothetical protein WD939_07835, partial [Dehalococcoidia bacterium]
MASISVRPATEADLLPLTKLDLTYAAGTRLLALERTGSEPELTFSLRWRGGEPVERAYAELTVEGLRGVRPGRNLRIKPYVLGSANAVTGLSTLRDGDAGLDVKYGVAGGLTW